MKIHSYQHNNPRYNAPTAKITSWFGLVTKEYFFNKELWNPCWCCCETGERSSYSPELSMYGILQQKLIKASNKSI